MANVNVPNIHGMTQAAAQQAVSQAGLTLSTSGDSAATSVVIFQDPAAGASVLGVTLISAGLAQLDLAGPSGPQGASGPPGAVGPVGPPEQLDYLDLLEPRASRAHPEPRVNPAHPELLADLVAVLGEQRVPVADVPARLRDLAPDHPPYRGLTG